ncbi:MAG: hypothetical protein A3F12_00455 [Gammaproteobacteria bacterium RIFCSPHIGHO2_12_FULL_38_14]|nr:MAG: hypothetical protein A3F12_00455 [Gammaproteobacteria bacterium RIFCSPHIGHO2_12_FULL_38_14]
MAKKEWGLCYRDQVLRRNILGFLVAQIMGYAKLKWIFISLAIALLSGCSALGTYMSASNPKSTYDFRGHTITTRLVDITPDWVADHTEIPVYRVGVYDILNIIVWNHPELTTVSTQMSSPSQSGLLVSADGTIAFPFAGTFKVAGYTIPEVQRIIEQRISKYIRNPQVTVRVTEFRSKEIQVMGEVGGAKTVPLTDKPFSLMDALNQSGGTSLMTANTASIFVIRGAFENLTIYRLNAKSPQTMMAAQRFVMKNNDIVYVPSMPITNWNRVVNQVLLPTFGSALTAKTIVTGFQTN